MDNATVRMHQAGYLANTLKEAIYINDKAKIRENIKALIDIKSIVKIQPIEICCLCSSHKEIFSSEINRVRTSDIATCTNCKFNHMFCQRCMQFIANKFGSINSAECFYCAYHHL